MTTINYGPYTPTQLKVVSLGVGISDDTNNTLNLLNNQSLIVGERIQDIHGLTNQKTYGVIVDTQGIAINTTTANRSLPYNRYAAYIDGDIRVTGNIFLDGSITCNIDLINGKTSNNYWNMAQDTTYTNIYYNENITIGNRIAASNNEYSVNIFKTAQTDIEQLQLSIQNLQASQLRMGIIGTAYNSPVIFNTNASSIANGSNGGGSLEFHMGRDQNYFSNVYTAPDGSMRGVPNYVSKPPPHFQLDYAGNVGINTSVNTSVPFYIRSANAGVISFQPVNTPMKLNVQGSTYSTNMLIYDYETAAMCNIDSLYVRRLGVTFEANQILPGTFALGSGYTFPNNLHVNENLTTYGTTRLNKIIANDSVINSASFCNDILFNRDIIVNQSLRIRGQIFTEVFNGLLPDGSSNYGFEMIQFTRANTSSNNINVIGAGIATPGRLGVGINPSANANNPVNNQFAVYKTNPNIWEVSLIDKSDTITGTVKAAYIGHPNVSYNFDSTMFARTRPGLDASLVFATPSYTDPDYSGTYSQFVQNMYFFPGIDMSATALPIISSNVPPTLGIFNNPATFNTPALRAVGINTYNPTSELDVNGSITFSGNLYYNPTRQTNQTIQLGIWKKQSYYGNLEQNAETLYYEGISYISENTRANHVGINTIPDIRYGLIVSGNTKVNDGLYITDTNIVDRKAAFWQDNRDSTTILNNVAPSNSNISGGLFTWANAGIGIKIPQANLEIKDNYNRGTVLKLHRGEGSLVTSHTTSIVYEGNMPYNSWTHQADHYNGLFQIGNGTDPFSSTCNVRYMWMKPNISTRYNATTGLNETISKPKVVIGGDLNIYNSSSNPDINAMLTVGGDMSVLGNISISGRFIINGNTLVNTNIPGSVAPPVLQNNDLFMGGGNIQILPGVNKSTIIGNPSQTQTNNDIGKILRVYQPSTATNDIVATFQGYNSRALIEITRINPNTAAQTILQFGIFDTNNSLYQGTAFAFIDGTTNNPYITFKTTSALVDNYVGFGVPLSQSPSAINHLYTSATGENMLRLTRCVLAGDTTNNAPQINLEKNYQGSSNNLTSVLQAPTSWTIKGPCASWNEKLSFIYNSATFPGDPTKPTNITSTEVVSIGNNGCIGIGNTRPSFALDILNSNNIGSLRLRNVGQYASPQIVLQSGIETFGADSLRDFRMSSYSNSFTFDSSTPDRHYFILDVDQSNHIGIGQAAESLYDVSINGNVNISNGLYVAGVPVFSLGDDDGIKFRNKNIFLIPDTIYPRPNGGVVINGSRPTGNLFDIFSGNNANMMVLDSSYIQAQTHMRTSNHANGTLNMYRIAMSNTSYLWQFYPNCYNSLTISDDNTGFQNVMSVAPTTRLPVSVPEFDFSINGSIILNSSNNPGIYFGNILKNKRGAMGYISGSNANICLMPSSSNNGIGIGTFNPQSNFHVVGTSLFDGYTEFNYNTYFQANTYTYGNSYVQGNQVTGVMTGTSSDIRLKKDLLKITYALDKINALSGYTYSLINEDSSNARRYTGLVAQEVQSVLPEAILHYSANDPTQHTQNPSNSSQDTSYLSVGYGNLMGLIVESIKELHIEVNKIKTHLNIK